MIQAGDKVFRYGDMNKVVEISRNGRVIAQFEYFMDGQLASAKYGDQVETFLWDGLALIQRNGKDYINEPYVTGGNPVMAGDDVLFNDMLGSTLAMNGKPVEMTAFGETADPNAFFTGKPMIPELGYSFLFRDYDPGQGKWTTTDPLAYPDGWNNLAYCNNVTTTAIDFAGAALLFGTNFTFHQGLLSWPQVTTPAYVNSEEATVSDIALHAACMAHAIGSLGFQFAINARHYLNASGIRQTYSNSFVDGFFSTVNIDTFNSAITSYVYGLNIEPGNTVSFSTKGPFLNARATAEDPGYNHWLSNQGFRYALAGIATMNLDGKSISVEYVIKFHDYYEFHNTGEPAGLFGIVDDDWRRLAVVGLARPFEIIGESSQTKLTIFLE